jgi:outer membrane immunogenic protein
MRKLLTTTAILMTAAMASPAMAQDGDQREFNGFYVGGSIGATFNSNSDNETILFDRDLNGTFGDTVTTSGGANAFSPGFCGGSPNTTAPAGGCNSEDAAIEYAIRAGYDYQTSGGLVLGVVAEIGGTDASSSVTGFSTTPASYTFNRDIDFTANLRARLGYTVTPTTLVYATAGVGYASLDTSFTTTNTANGVTRDLDDESWGLVLGAGVEQKITRNISVGLEYLYQQYEDESRVRLGNNGTTPATNPFLLGNANGTDFVRSDQEFDLHSVRAVVNFRF